MRRRALVIGGFVLGVIGCPAGGTDLPRLSVMGYVVEMSYDGDGEKEGVVGISDSGMRLFGSSLLSKKNPGTYSYPADSNRPFPRWVQVTWREGTTPGRRAETGTIVGNYRVEVLSRIPPEAFELARAAPKQPIVLRFRIRDDGVDFGWMVRRQDGVPFKVLMKGGDF